VTGELGPLSGTVAAFVAPFRVGHLATFSEETGPHVVPISPMLDLDRLVFASDMDTAKVRNIRGNGSVSVCFDAYDEDWSMLRAAVVFGEAYLIESGPEFARGRNLLYEKFTQYEAEAPIEEGTTVIVEVRPDRVVTWGLDG
jgi:nitroimidazol reductase NimA-like FMN-containing flavoprotein (pyridoxamine 5'-phosphate oxidase superfamily)